MLVVLGAFALSTPTRAEEPVNVPWPEFLPALASPNGTPGGQANAKPAARITGR